VAVVDTSVTTFRVPCVLKVQLLYSSVTEMLAPGFTVMTRPFWAAVSAIVFEAVACAPVPIDPKQQGPDGHETDH